MKPWQSCDQCKNKPLIKTLPGWYFLPDGKNVKECECHQTWKAAGVHEASAKRRGIQPSTFDPLSFYENSPDELSLKKVNRYLSIFAKKDPELLKHPASLFFYSKETFNHRALFQWMSTQLFEAGWEVGIYSMRTLLLKLTPTDLFEEEEANRAEAFHNELVGLDFLFISEAFFPSEQSFRVPYLERFLIDRMERHERPTLFLSTTELDKIASRPVKNPLYSGIIQEVVNRAVRKCGGELVFSSGNEVNLENDIFKDFK